MAYVWAVGSIWGTWSAAYVAAWVYADVSTNGSAVVLPYLVWILGIALATIASLVVCAAIACKQCSTAWDRSRTE